jgi:hypothetical protein
MNSKSLIYLRWILIIPAALLGAVLGQLFAILSGLILPDWITHLIGSAFMGSSFVFCGILTAPNKKHLIGKILFIVYSIIVIGIFIYSLYTDFEYNIWLLILNLIFGISSAFEATNVAKKLADIETEK